MRTVSSSSRAERRTLSFFQTVKTYLRRRLRTSFQRLNTSRKLLSTKKTAISRLNYSSIQLKLPTLRTELRQTLTKLTERCRHTSRSQGSRREIPNSRKRPHSRFSEIIKNNIIYKAHSKWTLSIPNPSGHEPGGFFYISLYIPIWALNILIFFK